MKTKWLVQDTTIDRTNIPRLIEEIKKQGMEVKLASKECSYTNKFLELFDSQDCVITYGSIEFESRVNRESKWVPGSYCTLQKYECSSYYPYYGECLLNSNYIMIPYGDLIRQKEFIFNAVGIDKTVFIRPNRGTKPFTGQIIYKEQWEQDVKMLGFYNLKPEELCVVAEPRNLLDEWRFVVVNGVVIAGSQYILDGTFNKKQTFPEQAWILAVDLAKKYQPDRAFTLDICKTKSQNYYLLEINSFSSSGLYDCNLEKVVREVSRAALEEWKEYYG